MTQPKVLLVTGSDTGVGKTVVTAALAVTVRGSVAVLKPTQAGLEPDGTGDLDAVRRLTGLDHLYEGVRLLEPLAPTTAGRRQGLPLPDLDVKCEKVDEHYHHEGPAHEESTRTEHYRWNGTKYAPR